MFRFAKGIKPSSSESDDAGDYCIIDDSDNEDAENNDNSLKRKKLVRQSVGSSRSSSSKKKKKRLFGKKRLNVSEGDSAGYCIVDLSDNEAEVQQCDKSPLAAGQKFVTVRPCTINRFNRINLSKSEDDPIECPNIIDPSDDETEKHCSGNSSKSAIKKFVRPSTSSFCNRIYLSEDERAESLIIDPSDEETESQYINSSKHSSSRSDSRTVLSNISTVSSVKNENEKNTAKKWKKGHKLKYNFGESLKKALKNYNSVYNFWKYENPVQFPEYVSSAEQSNLFSVSKIKFHDFGFNLVYVTKADTTEKIFCLDPNNKVHTQLEVGDKAEIIFDSRCYPIKIADKMHNIYLHVNKIMVISKNR